LLRIQVQYANDCGDHHPTYFMKQFIEATHNMFVIQQKRITVLEEKIASQMIIGEFDVETADNF